MCFVYGECTYTCDWVSVYVCVRTRARVCVSYIFVRTCICMLYLWVYYYFMLGLHLFPSQLQLTMRLPFVLNSPLLPLPVCFLASFSFPLLSVRDQSLATYHQFRRFVQIPGRVYMYFKHYNRPSYLTSSSFIRFLSTSLGLLTWHKQACQICFKATAPILSYTHYFLCCAGQGAISSSSVLLPKALCTFRGLWSVLWFCPSSSNTLFGLGTKIGSLLFLFNHYLSLYKIKLCANNWLLWWY